MRRITQVLAAAALILVAAGCTDQQARTSIQTMKDSLTPYFQKQYEWGMNVRNALCQLEFDVYNVKDSRGDTRTAGPATDPGSFRLCPDGPTDPNAGKPPQPPKLQ